MKVQSVLVVCALALSSCGETIDPGSKPVYPVKGTITVDGKPPGTPIQIGVHDKQGVDTKDPSVSSGLCNADGTFALNTYNAGDGVPKGDYTLTFVWKNFNPVSVSYSGEDKLKGKYDKVEDSPVKFQVDGTGPVDLGTIELTTE